MAQVGELNLLFLALVNNANIRMASQPAAGTAGVVVTAGKAALGAWKVIVAKAAITDPSWLWGVGIGTVDTTNPPGAATGSEYDIQIGTGEVGSEVAIAQTQFLFQEVTAVGEFFMGALHLPIFQRINGAPALNARAAQSDAANTHAVGVKALLLTGLGT